MIQGFLRKKSKSHAGRTFLSNIWEKSCTSKAVQGNLIAWDLWDPAAWAWLLSGGFLSDVLFPLRCSLTQANRAVSLLFFLGVLNPGLRLWFVSQWSLISSCVSAAEAGGCHGEDVNRLETNSNHPRKCTMRLLRRVWHYEAQMHLGYRIEACWRRM